MRVAFIHFMFIFILFLSWEFCSLPIHARLCELTERAFIALNYTILRCNTVYRGSFYSIFLSGRILSKF